MVLASQIMADIGRYCKVKVMENQGLICFNSEIPHFSSNQKGFGPIRLKPFGEFLMDGFTSSSDAVLRAFQRPNHPLPCPQP
jgi:hypothetical protein